MLAAAEAPSADRDLRQRRHVVAAELTLAPVSVRISCDLSGAANGLYVRLAVQYSFSPTQTATHRHTAEPIVCMRACRNRRRHVPLPLCGALSVRARPYALAAGS